MGIKVAELNKSIRQKESAFIEQKSELMVRLDAYQRDIQKLNEKVKYESIENSMLLRVKGEFQVLTKDHEKVRNENAHLKRQIISNGQKTTSPTKQQQNNRKSV